MTFAAYVTVMVAIAVVFFVGMAIAWRGRVRRDAAIAVGDATLSGEAIDEFPRASYVSTTPEGAPFQRLAIPGLRFKGYAQVRVRSDGVEITVTGENPVRVPAARVLGTGTASGRIGKAVERDGLSLLRWRPEHADAPTLESSFRFADPAEQARFTDAISALASNQTFTSATQEDA